MNFLKQTSAFVLGFLLLAGSALAQGQQMQSAQPDSITDKDLEKTVAVLQERQKIQRQSMKKLQTMLADKELGMRRFQQIMMSRQNPKMADSIKVTPKEQKIMKQIQPKLQKMQQQSQKQMISAMKQNGLNPQRFQSIMQAVQSDPALMKRFKKIAQDSASGNQR
jgi:hypothetical protein